MGGAFRVKETTSTKVLNLKRECHVPETDSLYNWILECGLEK